ncbi:Golgin sub A member 7 [Coemansia sp. RSA 455]|nr:Golgin sub A member 7 [Coemansia sp. S680]KAJ2063605.1 Golgin sub A member 7 [Coemansia sp. S155-1]KAJ2102150.1 Golgin sub A member 7 [Coemansia sp. RSA 922]KAJ2239224.1 Golgin sub A member 7 [Coemansia sp. RSA 455]
MSVASSDGHWSFENLTQSTDSGYPLITSTPPDLNKPRQQDPPLSLVLGSSDLRSPLSGSHIARAPSTASSSTTTANYHRRHHRSHSPRNINSSPEPAMHQPPARGYVTSPGSTPRSSVYSDRGVFAVSRQPEDSNTPSSQQRDAYSLPMQQPTTPPAVATGGGRGSSMVALTSRQVLNLNHNKQSPSHGMPLAAALAATADDVCARKTYALPASSDSAPQNALQHSQAHRIRIERDYSTGDARQFSLKLPDALAGRIDGQRFMQFVSHINERLAKAEGATARNVLEGCLAFATLYLSTLVIKPHFKKTVDEISRYIYHVNNTLFRPAGLLVIDPKQTAYMFIEIISL